MPFPGVPTYEYANMSIELQSMNIQTSLCCSAAALHLFCRWGLAGSGPLVYKIEKREHFCQFPYYVLRVLHDNYHKLFIILLQSRC